MFIVLTCSEGLPGHAWASVVPNHDKMKRPIERSLALLLMHCSPSYAWRPGGVVAADLNLLHPRQPINRLRDAWSRPKSGDVDATC